MAADACVRRSWGVFKLWKLVRHFRWCLLIQTLGIETDSLNQSDGNGDHSLQVQLGLELKP